MHGFILIRYLYALHNCSHPSSFQVQLGHQVLSSQNVGIGVVLAEIDLNYLSVLREDFPVWSHRKIAVNK